MLVWFALALGAAAASPLVRTQDQQLVCTAAGSLRFVNLDDGGAARATGGLQDCPQCILAGAPPRQDRSIVPLPAPASVLASASLRVPHASRTAPPLPARGPPELS